MDNVVLVSYVQHVLFVWLKAGVPKLWAAERYLLSDQCGIRSEIKYTINIICLNHPETTPLIPSDLWKKHQLP